MGGLTGDLSWGAHGPNEYVPIDVEFMPNHQVPVAFPVEPEGLRRYAAVIFSDVGSNSLLLHPESFVQACLTANRLDLH